MRNPTFTSSLQPKEFHDMTGMTYERVVEEFIPDEELDEKMPIEKVWTWKHSD